MSKNTIEKCGVLHGFRFTSEREVPELEATLREAVYEKNGAKLIFIDREDSNKTFAIAFKTIPEDSTGVFHIIEHSVLCGSDKYPVKEPFVELLKGSVKTFLNAFTFPDKTMYPVSSRNDKDFLNLVDVYMDAVLHPTAVVKPEIFYQEGWHYELHEGDSELGYKGVVFNEMKGAYSAADEVMLSETAKMIYKGSTYGYDSGGDPSVITDLTYEQFVSSHAKYYHPSNARIILDGSIDLDKTLSLLDSFLSEYDTLEIDTDIPFVQPIGHLENTVKYEIAPSEDPAGKARVCLGFLSSNFREREKMFAMNVLCDVLGGSNEAPFKKAMLDTGLCEDVNFITSYDGIQENSLFIEIKNVKEEDMKKAEETAIRILRDIADKGIDKELLVATFNNLEFRVREQDMATFPSGIAYAISALETWLYGGDPIDGLSFESDIAHLREAMAGDYYENLLRSVILDSKHSATLYMIPDPALGEVRANEERQKLNAAYEAMSDAERKEIIKKTEILEAWQKSEDTRESLDTLPKLLISDIESEPEKYPSVSYEIGGTEALYTKAASRGITYTSLLFDISDFSKDELLLVSLLTELYKNVPTKMRDALSLQTAMKTELGSFSVSGTVYNKKGKILPKVIVSLSALDSKLCRVPELVREVLFDSLFEDKDVIEKLLKQIKNDESDAIGASGHSVALSRAASYVSAEAAVSEYLSGIESYLFKKKLLSEFDSRADELCESLSSLSKKIFVKNRLFVATAGAKCDTYIEELVSLFSDGAPYESGSLIQSLGKKCEGIVIPAGIAFAGKAAVIGADLFPGSFSVARSILSYGYLWNSIRVQGGAYGAGFVAKRTSGTLAYYTYRDPNPARSVGIFDKSAEYLRGISESEEDITNFIIGASGDSDPLLTPKVLSALSLSAYMRGESYEDRARFRRELLSTTKEDLSRLADTLDGAFAESGACIVGGKDKLAECSELIESYIEI